MSDAPRSNAPNSQIPGLVLRERFRRYQTDNLVGISPGDFEGHLRSLIGREDAAVEGYSEADLDRQRDLSIKYFWGHHHDFGSFHLDGRMLDRHFYMMEHFLDTFPMTLADFDGADVFDIGCWTGGTALLLAALGGRVVAIEEVRKYAETVRFLAKSFAVDDRLAVRDVSLYACNTPEFRERFDIVHFPGVIYHLSDPLIALRILYNSLRIGGYILLESAGIEHSEPYCRFDGSMIHLSGSKELKNRGGWNWFMPSASAVERMLREAGFDEVQAHWDRDVGRVYAFGRKVQQTGICRAGLSVPDIP